MNSTITDGSTTGFVVVTVAESMPVAESLDMVRHLHGLGVHVASIVVNRRSPADAGDFLADRRKREDACLVVLRRQPDTVPMTELPLLAQDMTGEDALEELAALITTA